MATPLTDSINALTTYANEVTGQSDATLSDAMHTLASGYGGLTRKWKDFSGGNIQAIIGDGNAYINTGLLISHNSIFGIKFRPRDALAYEYIFGDWCSSYSERVSVQRGGPGSVTFYAYPVTPAYSEIVTDIAIIESGFINRGGNVISTSPLLLFKGYFSGREESQISKCSFYGLNFVDSNLEYLAKLVPWKDENDVICVKNLVTGDIYYNAGTGTFGYIDLDGVEHV